MKTNRMFVLAGLVVCIWITEAVKQYPLPASHVNIDWRKNAREELEKALHIQKNDNVAKNVVFFLGDGMGVTSVFAARVYSGQRMGYSGEEYQFEFEKMDHVALSKTYNVDRQVPDSAATATAFLSGIKANFGTLGVTDKVKRTNCSNESENKADSIVDWSLVKGKSVGLISTARVTHATPAAAYAHTAERDWESDTDFRDPEHQLKDNLSYNSQFHCKDIALQLVEDNPDIHVILGGGREKFLPNTMVDPEYPDEKGLRNDSRNLVEEWKQKKSQEGSQHSYVWNKSQLDSVDPQSTDYLFGLFEPGHMQYELDRNQSAEPSLAEMTSKAIRILQKNNKGFFLLVEGGRIDHAHHDGLAAKALHDTLAMDEAVKMARELTKEEDTLIVVTADHSHSFVTNGYPNRGNDILGTPAISEANPPLDNMIYTTLSYANGPGAQLDERRRNLTGIDTTTKDFLQPALVPLDSETHGGEDVPIYAHGPMAHLFHGVHEQNYIAHVMAYASCVGADDRHCEERHNDVNIAVKMASSSLLVSLLSGLFLIV